MDRSNEFFTFLHGPGRRDIPPRVLQTRSNTFNDVSYKILAILSNISTSINDQRDSFVDRAGVLLSRRSTMSDAQRRLFLEQTESTLHRAESLIVQLADSVRSGRMQFRGDAVDHCGGVLSALDHRLRSVRCEVAALRRDRMRVEVHSRLPSAPPVSRSVPDRRPPAPVDPEFAVKLEQENKSVMTELLESHEMVVETLQTAEQIAELHRVYNTMVSEQTEKIRLIRTQVEEAADSYVHGNEEVRKAADRSKLQHFWISVIVYVLALMLLLRQLKYDLR